MAISPLSSEPSARLLTELLWELALIDMDGREWELSMLLTVPVRNMYCSTSWRQTEKEDFSPRSLIFLGENNTFREVTGSILTNGMTVVHWPVYSKETCLS